MLGWLSSEIDLHQKRDLASHSRRGFVEFRDHCAIVDRVNHIEPGPGFPHLVRLQVTDQMPSDSEIGGLIHLLQRLLDFVFAKVELTGVSCGADGVNGKRFGDGE